MTIYIVSYVSYDDDGAYLYTESKPFKDFGSAKTAQMRYVQDARKEFEDMIDVGNENETAIWGKSDDGNYYEFERYDTYVKIIIELTEHEI